MTGFWRLTIWAIGMLALCVALFFSAMPPLSSCLERPGLHLLLYATPFYLIYAGCGAFVINRCDKLSRTLYFMLSVLLWLVYLLQMRFVLNDTFNALRGCPLIDAA